MEEFQCEMAALELIGKEYQVFPLAPNTKIPLKNTHGYLSATSDVKQVFQWLTQEPKANIGLRLDKANLLVVDVDLHGENDGRKSLEKLLNRGMKLPSDTYIEQSANGGLHYFFRYQGKATRKVNILPGIDILTDFVIVAPSELNGKKYKPVGECNIEDVKIVPNWLITMMQPKKEYSFSNSNYKVGKKYTGAFLDELVTGCEVGIRNEWIMRQISKMLSLGAEFETIYKLILVVNDNFLDEPLPIQEINATFKSRIRKHTNKGA